jgi:hypothetical protein
MMFSALHLAMTTIEAALKLPHAQADLSSPEIRLHQRLRYASRALSSR